MVKKGTTTEGGAKKDIAWKYGTKIEGTGKSYIYIKCDFCNKIIKGGVKRLKDHLGGTHKNVAPCVKVPLEVKEEIIDYMLKGAVAKHKAQREFEEMVDAGSYFGSQAAGEKGGSSCQDNINIRGIRGPMDRFIVNVDDDTEVGRPTTISSANAKEYRNRVCLDVGRFFCENGLPFNVASSPSFTNMCMAIGNYGRGFKPPSQYELRTWILKEEVKTTDIIVNELKKTWPHTGVTIMSDGWKDTRGRSLINVLVNNPHGTVFLKSIDASDVVKDANMLFKFLDDVVEEVGEDLVVQVITDNASAYKLAGQKLMEKRKHLYWTPCAAHCLDLMLERLGELPQHKNALIKAKKISNFIYNHGWVLALMRSFTNRELIRPAATRFATAYLTLQSILQSRQALESMFTSEKWASSVWANKSEGKEIRKIILKEKTFWPSVLYAIKTTKPLVGVLRMVDSEKEPAMGFIYGAIDRAKEEIAKVLGGEEAAYKEIWNIIDEKWDYQLHRPLHAAAYYLNPQFHYESGFSCHPEVKAGLFTCMDKLILDPRDKQKANLQLDAFQGRRGFFGLSHALESYKMRSPVNWWTLYGDEVPELTKFAIKILSLTCSSSGCERNWSTFNQIHTKRRNRLSAKRLDQLVYVMYNKKLKDRHLKHKTLKEEDDPLVLEDVPSDDDWIAGLESKNAQSGGPTILSDDDLDVSIKELGGNAQSRTSGQKRKEQNKSKSSGPSDKGKRPMLLVDEEEEEWENFDSDEDDFTLKDTDNILSDSINSDEEDEDDIN